MRIPGCNKPVLNIYLIFAFMPKKTKQNHYLLLTLPCLLLIATCVFVNPATQNEFISSHECPDFTIHCEHSHIHGLEDEILHGETIEKFTRPEIRKNIHFTDNKNIKDSFSSHIWQPPKNT